MDDQAHVLYMIKDRLIQYRDAPDEPYVLPDNRAEYKSYHKNYDEFQKEIMEMVKATSLSVLKKINIADASESKQAFMKRFRQEFSYIHFDNENPDSSVEQIRDQTDRLTTIYNEIMPYYNAAKFNIKDYVDQNKYNELSESEKRDVQAMFETVKYDDKALEEFTQLLQDHGYDIARERSDKKGSLELNKISKDDLFNTYMDKHKDLPSKKGIKIVNNVDTS